MDYSHPSWLTAAGAGGAYLLILAVMTVALFLVPYVLFAML